MTTITLEALHLRLAPVADCARYDSLRNVGKWKEPTFSPDKGSEALPYAPRLIWRLYAISASVAGIFRPRVTMTRSFAGIRSSRDILADRMKRPPHGQTLLFASMTISSRGKGSANSCDWPRR